MTKFEFSDGSRHYEGPQLAGPSLPRLWRQRYGEEFEALLEECLHYPIDVLDILLLGGLMLVFILGAIASTAAVWKILSNTTEEETTLSLLGYKTSVKLYEYRHTRLQGDPRESRR